MTSISSSKKTALEEKDDRILLQTRLVLIIVIPVLILAFLILYALRILLCNKFLG